MAFWATLSASINVVIVVSRNPDRFATIRELANVEAVLSISGSRAAVAVEFVFPGGLCVLVDVVLRHQCLLQCELDATLHVADDGLHESSDADAKSSRNKYGEC